MDAVPSTSEKMLKAWQSVTQTKSLEQLSEFLLQYEPEDLSRLRMDEDAGNLLHWMVRERWLAGMYAIYNRVGGLYRYQNKQQSLPIELAIQLNHPEMISFLWERHYYHDDQVGALFYRIATSQSLQSALPWIVKEIECALNAATTLEDTQAQLKIIQSLLSFQNPEQGQNTLWHVLMKESPQTLAALWPLCQRVQQLDQTLRLDRWLAIQNEQGNTVCHMALNGPYSKTAQRQLFDHWSVLTREQQAQLMSITNHAGLGPDGKNIQSPKRQRPVKQVRFDAMVSIMGTEDKVPLNEGHVSKKPSVWQRFVSWIKRVWQSFTAACARCWPLSKKTTCPEETPSTVFISSDNKAPVTNIPLPAQPADFVPSQATTTQTSVTVAPKIPSLTPSSPG